MGDESIALSLTNCSGEPAGDIDARALVLKISAKQTAKTTTKTV
jgi:hypothetical protein